MDNEFEGQLRLIFNLLSDDGRLVKTGDLIKYWQMSEYFVSFAVIDSFQKFSSYDSCLNFESFCKAVQHCLFTSDVYHAENIQALALPGTGSAVLCDSGYRSYDDNYGNNTPSNGNGTLQTLSSVKQKVRSQRVMSESSLRPKEPPSYDIYMNNSLTRSGKLPADGNRQELKQLSFSASASSILSPQGDSQRRQTKSAPSSPAKTPDLDFIDGGFFSNNNNNNNGIRIITKRLPDPPKDRNKSPVRKFFSNFSRNLRRSQSFSEKTNKKKESPSAAPLRLSRDDLVSVNPPVVGDNAMYNTHSASKKLLLKQKLRYMESALDLIDSSRDNLSQQVKEIKSKLHSPAKTVSTSQDLLLEVQESGTKVNMLHNVLSCFNEGHPSPLPRHHQLISTNSQTDKDLIIQQLQSEKNELVKLLYQSGFHAVSDH